MTSWETLADNLTAVRAVIAAAERRWQRDPGSVALLAVSKTKPLEAIMAAMAAGQTRFGESYIQESVEKIARLAVPSVEWHFIGPIQSNKTRPIAEHFQWVHSIDRIKVAQRLSDQRPANLPPLNICLQVNSSGEASKSGVPPEQLRELADAVATLPRLALRGLMTIPAPAQSLEDQRQPFRLVRGLRDDLARSGHPLDTLSMGMSDDLEAAIAEGSTMVRIGTAIFGARATVKP